jgi:hypothetical protein
LLALWVLQKSLRNATEIITFFANKGLLPQYRDGSTSRLVTPATVRRAVAGTPAPVVAVPFSVPTTVDASAPVNVPTCTPPPAADAYCNARQPATTTSNGRTTVHKGYPRSVGPKVCRSDCGLCQVDCGLRR